MRRIARHQLAQIHCRIGSSEIADARHPQMHPHSLPDRQLRNEPAAVPLAEQDSLPDRQLRNRSLGRLT